MSSSPLPSLAQDLTLVRNGTGSVSLLSLKLGQRENYLGWTSMRPKERMTIHAKLRKRKGVALKSKFTIPRHRHEDAKLK